MHEAAAASEESDEDVLFRGVPTLGGTRSRRKSRDSISSETSFDDDDIEEEDLIRMSAEDAPQFGAIADEASSFEVSSIRACNRP